MFPHIQQTPHRQTTEGAADNRNNQLFDNFLKIWCHLPGMLFEVSQPADVFLFEFIGPIGSIHRIRLTFDGLRYEFIQRLIETLKPIFSVLIKRGKKLFIFSNTLNSNNIKRISYYSLMNTLFI